MIGDHRRPDRLRCSDCDLWHLSVRREGQRCNHCVAHELVNIEKVALADILQWLRDTGTCTYCGEPSEEIEHVIPRTTNLPTYTVPSCFGCNSLAGGSLSSSIIEKQDRINTKRAKRYRKLLQMPDWTTDELDELGYGLRASIESALGTREVVKAQLAWSILGSTVTQ